MDTFKHLQLYVLHHLIGEGSGATTWMHNLKLILICWPPFGPENCIDSKNFAKTVFLSNK